jgi:photosystem II PsbY protein
MWSAGYILFKYIPVSAAETLEERSGLGVCRSRGLAAGVGLGAALLLASQKADAAQEVAQLAAGDNRFGIIATLFLPVLGWVLFNIGGPALNQLNALSSKTKGTAKPKITKKRAIAGALVGLSASSLLLAAPQADAATEVMQIAAGKIPFTSPSSPWQGAASLSLSQVSLSCALLGAQER